MAVKTFVSENFLKCDARGRVRYSKIALEYINEYEGYRITCINGLLNGTYSTRPIITISEGKAGRTLSEQVTLQYNSEVNKLLNKGYMTVSQLGLREDVFLQKLRNKDKYREEFDAYVAVLENYMSAIN